MRWSITYITAGVFLACMLLAPLTSAQDSGQLLRAIEKLETNLQQMIKKESSQRASETTRLQRQMKDLRQRNLSQPQLVDVMNDIEYLKAECRLLRNFIEKNKNQLASLDATGYSLETQKVDDLLQRVDALNRDIEELGSAPGTRWNAPIVKRGKINFTGFVHQQYYSKLGDDDQSTFKSRRARLHVKGPINEYAAIKIQGEFAGTPSLLDGKLTLSPDKRWFLDVGQYKPPFGTDFLTSATANPFVSSSKTKGLGTGRDIGTSITYKNKFTEAFVLKATAGLFNGSGVNTADANNDKNFVGRAEFTFDGIVTVAPNCIIGKTNDTGALKGDLNTYGGSVTWKWKNEIVGGEYIYSEVDNTEKAGWYVWGGHTFVLDSRFIPQIQVLARYEQYDTNLDLDGNRVNRTTIGANLFIDKKYTKIQVNYQLNGEEENSVDNDEFLINFQVAF